MRSKPLAGQGRSGRLRGAKPVDDRSEDVVAPMRAFSQGGMVAAFDYIGGRRLRKDSVSALRPVSVGVLYGAYDMTATARPVRWPSSTCC